MPAQREVEQTDARRVHARQARAVGQRVAQRALPRVSLGQDAGGSLGSGSRACRGEVVGDQRHKSQERQLVRVAADRRGPRPRQVVRHAIGAIGNYDDPRARGRRRGEQLCGDGLSGATELCGRLHVDLLG